MSKLQVLRSLVKKQLIIAADEIFGLFEKNIKVYEEEIARQRKMLYALKLETKKHKTDFLPPQHSVCKEEVSTEQRERSPSLDQEDPEPPLIKEEQEENWTGQGGEQLQGLEEADIITFTYTPVPVKSEDYEEKLWSSQLGEAPNKETRETNPLPSGPTEQMETELEGGDCGVLEPDIYIESTNNLEPSSGGQLLSSDCSETDDSSDEGKETRAPQSGSNTLKSKTQISEGQNSVYTSPPQCCKVCGKSFPVHFTRHIRAHSNDCALCGKHLGPTVSLDLHLQVHRTCNFCGKRFRCIADHERHVRIHTGERPFSCAVCGRTFVRNDQMQKHMKLHTREKPYSCAVCNQRFGENASLKRHMRIHTGEYPYSCSVCRKRFRQSGTLRTHKCHPGE